MPVPCPQSLTVRPEASRTIALRLEAVVHQWNMPQRASRSRLGHQAGIRRGLAPPGRLAPRVEPADRLVTTKATRRLRQYEHHQHSWINGASPWPAAIRASGSASLLRRQLRQVSRTAR